MLARPQADICPVIHRALMVLSLVCCTLVCASFVLFAHDQVAGASKHQQNELVAGAASGTGTAGRGIHRVAQPRRFIDSADHTLTAPFSSVVSSQNPWVKHGIPTVIALLVYGIGLGFLARFAQIGD